jgi:hypothetical protein
MSKKMEEHIIEKFGEEQASIIFTLGANYYNISKSLGLSFGLDLGGQMASLAYAFKICRDEFLRNQKDELTSFLTTINPTDSALGDVIDDDDDDDDDSPDGPDLDFLKNDK